MEEHAEYYVKLLMAEEAAVKHLEEAGEAAIEKKERSEAKWRRRRFGCGGGGGARGGGGGGGGRGVWILLVHEGGGCKDSFVAWEKCVEEAEEKDEDVVSKCAEMTMMLKKRMEAHSEYYEPVLRAEKVAEEEAVKQLEKEAGEAAVEKKEK
ncbi:hypothetical protein QQ045_020244 [Rhodiola kirilowii]